jgi:outer membrane protein assembly factor BamB
MVFFMIVAAAAHAAPNENVLTYKYDNQRTGWNSNETVLTPANVSRLRLEASVALDDQVDAQPLVLNGVVYVVTESNTVYAINGTNGKVILSNNLGSPVSTPPYGCNSGHIGITSTPVIAPHAGILYVMAYTYDSSGNPIFRLHALGTGTLKNHVAPVTVTASGTLANGQPYAFDAAVQRQRPALLLSVDGDIYAGFGSFCDTYKNNRTRGWLLGWHRGKLTPIGAHLDNEDARTPSNDYFLSSIWMSGSGIAEDNSANLYFATGNSNPDAKSYNQKHNLSESVIELSPDLNTVESFFTPTGARGVKVMEENDLDMAGGGVLLTPDGYVTGAGKAGQMYLLHQRNLGGRALDNYVSRVNIGACLCGESYYQDSSGAGHIVSSGGNQRLQVWGEPSFQLQSRTAPLNGGAGFFTSVSSNGTRNALIWAVDRPANSSTEVTLDAYDPAAKKIVFSQAAGTWPNAAGGHNNTVPVVANGHVYVASYEQLTIWGLDPPAAAVKLAHPAFADPVQLTAGEHDIFGTITAMSGTNITVKRRDGTLARVSTLGAAGARPAFGEPVRVVGSGTTTALRAQWVARAQGPVGVWPPDR